MSNKLEEIKQKIQSLLSLWIEPDQLKSLNIKASLDERGVLVEITGPKNVLSLIIGKRGSTVTAIRKILKSIGGSLKASISLKVHSPQQ